MNANQLNARQCSEAINWLLGDGLDASCGEVNDDFMAHVWPHIQAATQVKTNPGEVGVIAIAVWGDGAAWPAHGPNLLVAGCRALLVAAMGESDLSESVGVV